MIAVLDLVPLPCIICDFVVFGGYFGVIPVHFKCMHDIHFNKERTARNPKLVSMTLKWSQTPLVRQESLGKLLHLQ